MPGNLRPGEIILGKPFLFNSGLNVKKFLADNLERLASIDNVNLQVEENPVKVGKLGLELLSNGVSIAKDELQPSHLCSKISKGNFSLKEGD